MGPCLLIARRSAPGRINARATVCAHRLLPSIQLSSTQEYHEDEQQHMQRRRSISILIQQRSLLDHSRTWSTHHQLSSTPLGARSIVSWLPEVVQNFSIWGGSGYILSNLHATTGMPFWACFATVNIALRTALFPMVIYGANMSIRFAKILPDVQLLVSLFQRDLKTYRDNKARPAHFWHLTRTNLQSVGAIYKHQKFNPFAIFLSPLIQIPAFVYCSVDLRKIVNGLDPELAQQLVESGVAWVPDLTEPDPWFGLPVLAGLMLYTNLEVALGRRNVAGEAASKADISILMKDIVQSFAVFMPCFTSYLPGGMQVYLITSFCFTIGQSAALRYDPFRLLVGLPSIDDSKPEKGGEFVKQMVELKKLQIKAQELRGDGPVLGKGVLMHGMEISFPGNYRKSSIVPPTRELETDELAPSPFMVEAMSPDIDEKYRLKSVTATLQLMSTTAYIHGVSAPPWQVERQQLAALQPTTTPSDGETSVLSPPSDKAIEMANRGERFVQPSFAQDSFAENQPPKKLNVNRLRKHKKSAKRKSR